MLNREISKTPAVPYLSKTVVTLLTELCFGRAAKPQPSDLIFVYGTPYFIEQTALTIQALLEKNISKRVIITGGIVPHGECLNTQKSEAQLVYEKLPHYFDDVQYHLEQQSTNTLANVTEALKIFDFQKKDNLCFVFPSHGAMRGYLTLRKFLPNAIICQYPYDAHYPGEAHPLTIDNWHKTPDGQKRIWGEFLRIKQYGQRGDIAFDEVKQLIQDIDKLLID